MDTRLAINLWLEAVTAEGRSPETVRNYTSHTRPLPSLLPMLGSPDGPLALRRFLMEYRKGHAADSVRTVFVAWRAFFNWCVREGLLDRSPLHGMRQPKSPETAKNPYSRGELTALFRYLEGVRTPVGLRNYAACSLLLDCGLRASELCRLTLDDVLEAGLMVRMSKSGRPRLVPMGAKAAKSLGRYLSFGRPHLRPRDGTFGEFPLGNAPLFVNQFGRGLNRWGLQGMLGRVGSSVGFHLNAHKFRHTFATEHLRAGTPTETLRRLGGWADFSVLRLYAHLSVQDMVDAQLRASPLDRVTR